MRGGGGGGKPPLFLPALGDDEVPPVVSFPPALFVVIDRVPPSLMLRPRVGTFKFSAGGGGRVATRVPDEDSKQDLLTPLLLKLPVPRVDDDGGRSNLGGGGRETR